MSTNFDNGRAENAGMSLQSVIARAADQARLEHLHERSVREGWPQPVQDTYARELQWRQLTGAVHA